MVCVTADSVIATPDSRPGLLRPDGLSSGVGGRQGELALRSAPTCQSWGQIRPPTAFTALTTSAQRASASVP